MLDRRNACAAIRDGARRRIAEELRIYRRSVTAERVGYALLAAKRHAERRDRRGFRIKEQS